MKSFDVNLVKLVGPDFRAVTVRTVTVEARDAFSAVLFAADYITEAEASSVFATLPAEA